MISVTVCWFKYTAQLTPKIIWWNAIICNSRWLEDPAKPRWLSKMWAGTLQKNITAKLAVQLKQEQALPDMKRNCKAKQYCEESYKPPRTHYSHHPPPGLEITRIAQQFAMQWVSTGKQFTFRIAVSCDAAFNPLLRPFFIIQQINLKLEGHSNSNINVRNRSNKSWL